MADRGAEIEGFFWLLLRLAAVVFGYLMAVGGALFALAFLIDQWRTGAIAIAGQAFDQPWERAWLTAVPVLVGLAGVGLARLARRDRSES